MKKIYPEKDIFYLNFDILIDKGAILLLDYYKNIPNFKTKKHVKTFI